MSNVSKLTLHGHMQRCFGHPDGCVILPELIGKWIVHFIGLDGFFSRTTAVCVVDDFGNLVRVSA
jgi:hypothetical protein